MGYKLAGCEVLGCCEIDPRMNKTYVLNHKPKYNYLMDIREFNKLDDLPEELYHLDILDGSPPCSTFSIAGQREDAWGVEKVFREGQAKQTLDDLLFVFIETVGKLKPKVAIMENVDLPTGPRSGARRQSPNTRPCCSRWMSTVPAICGPICPPETSLNGTLPTM